MASLLHLALIAIVILIITLVLIVILLTRSGKNKTTAKAFNPNMKVCPICKTLCKINQNFCTNCKYCFATPNINPNQQSQQSVQQIQQ